MPVRTVGAVAALAAIVVFVACSSTRVAREPDGTFHLVCHGSLAACATKADHLCGGEYAILSGRVERGARATEATHASASDRAELVVRCGDEGLGSSPAQKPAETDASTPAPATSSTERAVGAPEPDAGAAQLDTDAAALAPNDEGASDAGAPTVLPSDAGSTQPLGLR